MGMKTKVAQVDSWNASYPSGTPVIVTRDNVDQLETTTRSEAWLLGGQPVVMVRGISGGYLLSRVKPVKVGEA